MNVLFVCTHNRCRSILSEAIFNHMSDGRIRALSAGSQPVGAVHPLSTLYLGEKGIETEGLQSQSWEAFAEINPEIVITVCDSAAGEQCPLWMGNAIKVHWGLPDPSKLEGSDDAIKTAFFTVMAVIEQRVEAMLALDFTSLDSTALKAALDAIAEDYKAVI